MNGKITLTILLSFIVAIGIFYIVIIGYQENFNSTIIWAEFISDNLNTNQKKIFIIGNSHVGSIDPNYVEKKLKEIGIDFKIFNLSVGGDYPQKRENTVGSITALKPDLVVYGIDYRSFEAGSTEQEIQAVSTSEIGEIENIFPRFQDIFSELSSLVISNEEISKIPQSPKIVTLRIINHVVHGSVELERLDLNSQKPLITDEAVGLKPMNNSELDEWIEERRPFRGIPELDKNLQFKSLEKILDKFKENEVAFTIFTTPHHNEYLEYLPDRDKQTFNQILNEIKMKYNIEIYRYDEKYKEQEIFSNPTHVAIETSQNYSNDIAELIEKELEK